MKMLYKYQDAFSLRDEIGTCPNVEVEIEVTDKSPFFIRPCHVKVRRQRQKEIMLPRDIERRFSAYSSPVMLISRKVTKDKRVVTYFRHLNMRIA